MKEDTKQKEIRLRKELAKLKTQNANDTRKVAKNRDFSVGGLPPDTTHKSKTSSNDVLEIHKLFGIEATRNKLIEEITSVVEYAGEYVNSRHIELLCDTMTFSGNLISINRQGINRGDVGPLAKCSFEDTTDQLIKSSIFGEVDGLNGVSSNIMLGQKIKAGTNMCELLLDEEELFNNMDKINEEEEEDEIIVYSNNNIDVALDDIKDDDYLCDINSFDMSI